MCFTHYRFSKKATRRGAEVGQTIACHRLIPHASSLYASRHIAASCFDAKTFLGDGGQDLTQRHGSSILYRWATRSNDFSRLGCRQRLKSLLHVSRQNVATSKVQSGKGAKLRWQEGFHLPGWWAEPGQSSAPLCVRCGRKNPLRTSRLCALRLVVPMQPYKPF